MSTSTAWSQSWVVSCSGDCAIAIRRQGMVLIAPYCSNWISELKKCLGNLRSRLFAEISLAFDGCHVLLTNYDTSPNYGPVCRNPQIAQNPMSMGDSGCDDITTTFHRVSVHMVTAIAQVWYLRVKQRIACSSDVHWSIFRLSFAWQIVLGMLYRPTSIPIE